VRPHHVLLRKQLAKLARRALALAQALRELAPRGALRRQLPLVARALALRRQHRGVGLYILGGSDARMSCLLVGLCGGQQGVQVLALVHVPCGSIEPALQCLLAHTHIGSSAQTTTPQHMLAFHPPPLIAAVHNTSVCV